MMVNPWRHKCQGEEEKKKSRKFSRNRSYINYLDDLNSSTIMGQ
jgi:hypothetical protein